MSEWIVDARIGTCPYCDRDYDSLALHWARNQSCDFPEPDDAQLQTIRGCLLGDGHLDAPNDNLSALCISSVRYDHIEWLHDQLGWLSRGIHRDDTDAYRLRTTAHPVFTEFRPWMDAPPSDWTPSRRAARVWYACDGGLEWSGTSTEPRAAWTITDDATRQAVARLLTELGFEPMVWERRVALPIDETERFLNWLGDPTPGSEYKWTRDRDAYRQRRAATGLD